MANKVIMKFSTSLVIKKHQIKTSIRYYSIISKVAKTEMTDIEIVGKDVGTQEFSYMAGEGLQCYISLEKRLGSLI